MCLEAERPTLLSCATVSLVATSEKEFLHVKTTDTCRALVTVRPFHTIRQDEVIIGADTDEPCGSALLRPEYIVFIL